MVHVKGAAFWETLERHFKEIPFHLKFICNVYGVNDHLSFLELNNNDLLAFQELVRSSHYESLIPQDADKNRYYAGRNACDFQFNINELYLFKSVRQFIFEQNPATWEAPVIDQPPNVVRTERNPAVPGSSSPSLEAVNEGNLDTPYVPEINQPPSGVINEEITVEPRIPGINQPPSLHDNSKKKKGQSDWESSTLLEMMNYFYERNVGLYSTRHEFSKTYKQFWTYVFLAGGPALYANLSANLPIPCTSTCQNHISEKYSPVVEGEVRAEGLKEHLTKRNLPLCVWLSEDATSLSGRVEYDPVSNKLVGLILPLDPNSSMPITDSFMATSARAMENHMNNNKKASLLYTYMAQPLQDDAPPYCVCLFGTNGCMNYKQVMNRWKYITDHIESQGIEVAGFSADGDKRVMKAYRIHMNLGTLDTNNYEKYQVEGFHAKILPKQICIEDVPHLGNKLNNRLFKDSFFAPMGKFSATAGDIITMVAQTRKDRHNLNLTDLTDFDKMNFGSTMRVCDPKIWKLLRETVPHSLGTQTYLKITFYSMQAMLNIHLKPLDRVYLLWYSIYFTRMWKSWLTNSEFYSDVDNFVTDNAYDCLELNGHGLLNMIFKCLEEGNFDRLLPWLKSSQACEGFFRNLRALSPVFSTVVNCSVLSALHKVQRIQVMNDTLAYDWADDSEHIHFPRNRFLNGSFERQKSVYEELPSFDLPTSIETIKVVLDKAKSDAYKIVSELGMDVRKSTANKYQGKKASDSTRSSPSAHAQSSLVITSDEESDSEEIDNTTLEFLENSLNPINLREFADNEGNIGPSSNKVLVKDSSGKVTVVKKSGLCYSLDCTNKKMSSDRLLRVRQSDDKIPITFRENKITDVKRERKIYIQDYCVFKCIDSDDYLIGLICDIAFMAIDEGKKLKWKETTYRKSFVEVEDGEEKESVEEIEDEEEEAVKTGKKGQKKRKNVKKTLSVFGRWFCVNPETRRLVLMSFDRQGYVPVRNYHLTIPPPELVNGEFHICESVWNQISSLVMREDEL